MQESLRRLRSRNAGNSRTVKEGYTAQLSVANRIHCPGTCQAGSAFCLSNRLGRCEKCIRCGSTDVIRWMRRPVSGRDAVYAPKFIDVLEAQIKRRTAMKNSANGKVATYVGKRVDLVNPCSQPRIWKNCAFSTTAIRRYWNIPSRGGRSRAGRPSTVTTAGNWSH